MKNHVILAVDDDRPTLDDLADTIKSLLCVPVTAATQEGALKVLESTRPCMVLLDLQIPVDARIPPQTRTGFNLLRLIRHRFPKGELIIILISAHVKTAATVTEAFREGIDDYVGKPFVEGCLEDRIRFWLERCPKHCPGPISDGLSSHRGMDIVFDGSPNKGGRHLLKAFGKNIWVRPKSMEVLWKLFAERKRGKGGWTKVTALGLGSDNPHMALKRTREDLGRVSSKVIAKRRGQLRMAISPERTAVNEQAMREHFDYLDIATSLLSSN